MSVRCAHVVLPSFLAAMAALLVGCATPSGTDAPVQRAVTALGGADALRNVRTLEASGTARHWDPDSSNVAKGEARLAGESSFVEQRDLARQAARTDWQRKLVYPGVREYRFAEVTVAGTGYVAGVDSSNRMKQSTDSNPPAHAMSRYRVATIERDLARSSPTLLMEMQANPAQVQAQPDTTIGRRAYPTVRYRPAGRDFVVMFDPATGLPARVRTLDYDNMRGDSTYDLVFEDWRDVSGIKFAYRQLYQWNGMTVVDTRFDKVQVNPTLAADRFQIPAAYAAAAPTPPGTVPYQWMLRRMYIGALLDTDSIAYDPAESSGMRWMELAPGVLFTQGVSHNSMVVEMSDHLIVFEAPISDAFSQAVLAEMKKRFPNKPVRTVVLTHHHMDHAYGARTYMAQGATLVVNNGNATVFRDMAQASHSRSGDLPSTAKLEPKITEVADRLTLTDGKRNVTVYSYPNPHSAVALFGYVEDAKLGFVTDVWTPVRETIGAQLTSGQAALAAAVQKAGIQPERFAGGHGGVASYADIAAKAK